VTDGGEEILRAGDRAAFRAGDSDGHHLQNRSQVRARVLEIGSANLRDDEAQYPDFDLHATVSGYFRKDGTPH
jgi:uncharacterized cupin superfamily protein